MTLPRIKITAALMPLLAAAAFSSSVGQAADAVTLQLKWVPQAQFAGYYAALHKGFYRNHDLNVTILPGGAAVSPVQNMRAKRADVVVTWMGDALAAREKGIRLVNIAQIFKRAGLMLTCRRDAGIAREADFKGKTLGVWFYGNEYAFLNWMSRIGLATDGGANGVTVLRQDFNVTPLVDRSAECISTMSYNEYWSVIDAGLKPEDLIVFKYETLGVSLLEDGLYVLEDRLADRKFADRIARFLRASLEGWAFAAANPEEAVDILITREKLGRAAHKHQSRMLAEVAKLISADAPDFGRLDPADYERTVGILLSSASNSVITKPPKGAWTHDIWDLARRQGAERPLN